MLKMGRSFFGIIAGLIFLVIGIAHSLNGLGVYEIMYGTWIIPSWFTWLVVLVSFVMALVSIRNLK
jgi:hypothetical protein